LELVSVHPNGRALQNGARQSVSTSAPVLAVKCIEALRLLQDNHRESLLDLVVPVATVMLHAHDKAVRDELWQYFVRDAVRDDKMLAHLFFWAFRCVALCPEAEAATQKEAGKLQNLVVSQTHQGTSKYVSITPLVDLFDDLHHIGDLLVDEKDRGARQQLLKSSLLKVNEKMGRASTEVPALLLVPDPQARRPGCLPNSTLLQMSPDEGAVLSSKARAPFFVLLEVETSSVSPLVTTRAKSSSWCPCRSRAPKSVRPSRAKLENGASPLQTLKGAKTKGLFKEESWPEVQERVRRHSDFGRLPDWGLISLIVKSRADDVRQEEMAYRLLKWFQRVFTRIEHTGQTGLWMRPFLILATTHDAGCLEAVPNAISIDALKKSYGSDWKSLKEYFSQTFPEIAADGHVSLTDAIQNFVHSMAAYSIICYVLSIRDRHNGNILLDDVGHVIHVDFGFMLCGAPGGRAIQQMGGFEPSGAFKLTSELHEVLDWKKGLYTEFKQSVEVGLEAVRRDAEELLALLQLSLLGSENSSMACFDSPRKYPEAVLEDVCDRLCLPRAGGDPRNVQKEEGFSQFVDRLIDDSTNHWRSRLYDYVQYKQNGIM
jgi:hypothetical protein